MAEWSANAVQTVNPGEAVIFTDNPVPPITNLVRHRDGTGAFLLSGVSTRPYAGCPCKKPNTTSYRVNFDANIAVPTGEAPGEIGVAVQIDGATEPTSLAASTPVAVEQFNHVGIDTDVRIWLGCCESVSVINNGTIPILIRNANLVIGK